MPRIFQTFYRHDGSENRRDFSRRRRSDVPETHPAKLNVGTIRAREKNHWQQHLFRWLGQTATDFSVSGKRFDPDCYLPRETRTNRTNNVTRRGVIGKEGRATVSSVRCFYFSNFNEFLAPLCLPCVSTLCLQLSYTVYTSELRERELLEGLV